MMCLLFRPSFVMPYMVGYTDDVEKSMFLRCWGVPYWALAYVFGRNAQYWYRIDNHIGREQCSRHDCEKPR